ncbi:MAG: hypothetical protein ABI193_21445 [Minicystis sp.]
MSNAVARPALPLALLLTACSQGPAAPVGPLPTTTLPPSAEVSAPAIPARPEPAPPRRPNPLLCKQLGLPCVFVELRTSSSDYRATFGAGGHFQAPRIPLSIVLNNDGEGAWNCQLEELTLHVEAQRSKRIVNKTFPAPEVPIGCRLDKGESRTLVLELGDFLTEIASGYMKGDVLSIKAEVTIEPYEKGLSTLVESTTVKLAVFVPEG